MSTTIKTVQGGFYEVKNPWNQRTKRFSCILHAVDYCRNERLKYSIEL